MKTNTAWRDFGSVTGTPLSWLQREGALIFFLSILTRSKRETVRGIERHAYSEVGALAAAVPGQQAGLLQHSLSWLALIGSDYQERKKA